MKKIFLFSLLAVIITQAYSDTFNIEQVRFLALANSRSLARYELSLRSSIINERNHIYSMLPSPSADYSASMFYLRDWHFVNPVDNLSTGMTVAITQRIFEGGKSFVQKAINEISTESIRKDALAEYYNVLDTADNAYYAVLEAQAAFEASEMSLQTAALSLSMAEIRQANGMINQGDYLRALAEKETRENARNQARRSYALSITRLRSIIGVDTPFELEQIDFSAYEELIQFLAAISDEDAALLYGKFWNILAESNPSLARAALNTQIAERNLSIARRDNAPVISATIFSTGLNYTSSGGFSHTSSGGVTIRGSIPIDFWVTANRIQRSKIARESSFLDYIGTENSLETELESSLLNAFTQAGSVLSSRRSLEYSEKHFEFVMERYRLSLSSVQDVSEASSLLITSQNNLTRALYGFLQSLSKLRSLCAIDDEERLIGIFLD